MSKVFSFNTFIVSRIEHRYQDGTNWRKGSQYKSNNKSFLSTKPWCVKQDIVIILITDIIHDFPAMFIDDHRQIV